MKLLGMCMLLAGGFILRGVLLRFYRERMELGEELCRGLDELRQGIFHRHRPLPEVLRRCREMSRHSSEFWGGILLDMEEERPFLVLWEERCAALSRPYGELWQDLGRVLTTGEREELLALVREETHLAVMEQRQYRQERNRLVTTLCLSFSVLLGVVLL